MKRTVPIRRIPAGFLTVALAVVFGLAVPLRAAELYREPFRPQFHFTPERNWMNDPNGMVYYDGEYHLFYQYNPKGDKWGHMSWGHAVSHDLIHWEHLPLALPEENGVMIFSGSAVVDWKNTTGFGKEGKPPLVAIYTGHYTAKPLQNQHIAYSNDRGRTWTKFAGNPVLDIGARDFRDPKVLWHESTSQWVMTVAMPTDRKVRFYGSPNLKDWTLLGSFGPAGAIKGIWECPDLFPVKVEGERRSKWVLIVNIGSASVAGGSGGQYFVGEFDGRTFVPDPASAAARTPAKSAASTVESANWVDYARDYYAAVSWSDVPKRDGRRLWLGWMSNWEYAQDVPTSPWRSAMSIPRSLTLSRVNDQWRLVQSPVQEIEKLRGEHERLRFRKLTGDADLSKLKQAASDTFELEANLQPSNDAVFELVFRKGASEKTTLRVDVPGQKVTLDRTHSGRVDFHKRFAGIAAAPIRLVDGRLKLRVFVDTSSVEVFVNDGETVLTSLIFPSPESTGVGLSFQKGELRRGYLEVWKLRSAWPR